MKIAVITDIHLGYRQYKLEERKQDFYDTFQKAIDLIIKNDVDLVLNCGDTFDKAHESAETIDEFRKGLKKLKEHNIKMIAILGNHEVIQRDSFVPILNLYEDDYDIDILGYKGKKDYITIDTDIGELLVSGVSFLSASQSDSLKNKLQYLDTLKSDFKILMLHQAIKEDFPFSYEIEESDLPTSFNCVLCGHIHELCDYGVRYYPGSLNPCNIKEAMDPHGVTFITINKQKKYDIDFVEIEQPRKMFFQRMTYNDDFVKNLKDFAKENGQGKNILHLEVMIDENQIIDANDFISREIQKEFLRVTTRFKYKEEQKNNYNFDMGKTTIKDILMKRLEDESNEVKELTIKILEASKDNDSLEFIHDNYENNIEKSYKKDFKDLENKMKAEIKEYENFFNKLGEDKYARK